jgi:hypothetical protein
MKGIQGLIIAIGLGVAGALFNFAYLYGRAQKDEAEVFIGIDPKVTVARGDALKEEHLVPVEIPKRHAGNLKDFAILYAARRVGAIDQKVTRTVKGGSLLLRTDVETPPPQLSFGQNVKAGVEERAMGVPIDTRRVVPSLVEPGDMVTFIVPGSGWDIPAPASGDDEPGKTDSGSPTPSVKSEPGKAAPAKTAPLKPTPAWSASRPPSGTPDLIGPFKVLSMGNRLGSTEVMRANRIAQSQENVMLILVHVEKDKNNKWRLEPEAERLERILDEGNNRPLSYLHHPRAQRPE